MAASGDSDEKTLPATQRRLDQAREDGQTPRSKALASALVLALAVGAFTFTGPMLAGQFDGLLKSGLAFDHAAVHRDGLMIERLGTIGLRGLLLALPLCLLLAVGALMAPMLLGGFILSPKALEPKWDRLNPISGLQKMFSGQNIAELVKTICEALIVVTIIGVYIYTQLDGFGAVLGPSIHGPLARMTEIVLFGFLIIVLAVAGTALADVPLQIWRHHHNLRMSPDEVKREARESEGDPQIKARVRQLQREMARKRMMGEVPKANVVITNPTHFAVALMYDEVAGGAPRVVAKGRGEVARRIREIATEARVPLVEAPPLARALHKHAELGAEIPHALFNAVAQVLAFVYRLRASAQSIDSEPYALDAVEVPGELDPGPQIESTEHAEPDDGLDEHEVVTQ